MTGMCWVRGLRFQPAADLEAVHARHHHVEQDDVGAFARANMQRLRTAPRGPHLEIFGRQPRLEQLHVGVDVVNHKHAGGHDLLPCYRATPMNWRTVSRNMATEMGLEI